MKNIMIIAMLSLFTMAQAQDTDTPSLRHFFFDLVSGAVIEAHPGAYIMSDYGYDMENSSYLMGVFTGNRSTFVTVSAAIQANILNEYSDIVMTSHWEYDEGYWCKIWLKETDIFLVLFYDDETKLFMLAAQANEPANTTNTSYGRI